MRCPHNTMNLLIRVTSVGIEMKVLGGSKMENSLTWVGYLCFFLAGVQVIRLIKLRWDEKKKHIEEAKRAEEVKRLEEEKRAEHEKSLEEERKRKKPANENNRQKYPGKKANVEVKLWGVSGIYANTSITLKQEMLFGRDYSCNLVFPLDTPQISRKHCMLRYDKKKEMFCLTDLGSRYGTFWGNGRKLRAGERVWLKANEEFILGNQERFRVGLKLG